MVIACCGDVPAFETMAAVDILRHSVPEVEDQSRQCGGLMTLQQKEAHPRGLSDVDLTSLFAKDRVRYFCLSRLSWLIHRLTYKHANA